MEHAKPSAPVSSSRFIPSPDQVDIALALTVQVLVIGFILLPGLAQAASPTGGAFGGLTSLLKSIANQLIYEWGYYIGIITLAIQGYRWKTGRIDLMALGTWALGISLVFFAPNIVGELRARSGGSIA